MTHGTGPMPSSSGQTLASGARSSDSEGPVSVWLHLPPQSPQNLLGFPRFVCHSLSAQPASAESASATMHSQLSLGQTAVTALLPWSSERVWQVASHWSRCGYSTARGVSPCTQFLYGRVEPMGGSCPTQSPPASGNPSRAGTFLLQPRQGAL